MPLFKQLDVTRQPGRGDETVGTVLWLTACCLSAEVTSSELDSHRESKSWTEEREVLSLWELCVLPGWLCQTWFSCQASRNVVCTVGNQQSSLIYVLFIWFPSLPEEGSTLLPNVAVTSIIYSLPALKSLLCNLLKQSMQAKLVVWNAFCSICACLPSL